MNGNRRRKKVNQLNKTDSLPSHYKEKTFSPEISINEQVLEEIFENCSDLVIRPILVNGKSKMLLVYLDGLSDTKTLDEIVIKPIMFEEIHQGKDNDYRLGNVLKQQLVAIAQVKSVSKVKDFVDDVLKANVGVLVDGETNALIADLKGFEKRGVEEPSSEVTIRGPRDGFTESLRTNTTLLRRRIRSTRLKLESLTVGELSQTDVAIAYIEGIAPDSLLEEVRVRISRIQIDGVLESEYIEEFIEDVPFSPFPQIQNTERPDIVAANLLEGKVAIIVDNTPFVLIVPMTFWSGLQAVEDYYERFMYTTFIRFVRYILFNVSIFLPSFYVALTTYHPKLIPTDLLISVAAAREGVPFPAIIEALIMEFMFEGLREAGIRLPKPVGSAVSIVGALVIGQAAVQAGIVSAPMVIVVATTGIASFAIPRYNFGTAFRMIRFCMLILAGCFGFYGITVGFIALTIHLVNLRSFGVPYFSPVAPQIPGNMKDILIRVPRWAFNYRPALISGADKKRIPKGQKPSPKREE
jgi:spore germination protein KA